MLYDVVEIYGYGCRIVVLYFFIFFDIYMRLSICMYIVICLWLCYSFSCEFVIICEVNYDFVIERLIFKIVVVL